MCCVIGVQDTVTQLRGELEAAHATIEQQAERNRSGRRALVKRLIIPIG
jgi:hypothetical protein